MYDAAVNTAYSKVEPVHLLMLCSAFDTKDKVWRSPPSLPARGGDTYGRAAPLFSPFRFTTDAPSVQLAAGVGDPGPTPFASFLRDCLSITLVHLPLVPRSLADAAEWDKVATLPEHRTVLQSDELRQWLHYLAHTEVKDRKVQLPQELQSLPIFVKSAATAEAVLDTRPFGYSGKQMADLALQLEPEKEAVAEAERKTAEALAEVARLKAILAEREKRGGE